MIQKEKFDPLSQCCVRNADTKILGSDLGYAGTELLVILNKRISQRHDIPELSNTTSSETQTSAFSKIPDKSLELELHQYAYTQPTLYIFHHGSKYSRTWLTFSLSTIYITHYSFEELRRVFALPCEISCELNIKMKTWNTLILCCIQQNCLWGIKCSSILCVLLAQVFVSCFLPSIQPLHEENCWHLSLCLGQHSPVY